MQFGLSPYKCGVGKLQCHYHICFCYYWHNKLRRQFVCAVVRVIESNYPMLGKWLCTKRNPSGIHKAISEVRQSWNVGALHINSSRSNMSFESHSTCSARSKSPAQHQSSGATRISEIEGQVIIEGAWHTWNEECLGWRTISNEPYQFICRGSSVYIPSRLVKHWVDVSNRSRLQRKQKLVD